MKAMLSLLLIALLAPVAVFAEEPAGEAAGENPKVLLETSMGRIVVELYPDKAPGSVENFLAYVDEGFYADTVFHRVIPNFMVQGGGFTADLTKKPTKAGIQNEADNGLANERGTIAMARTSDPHSATAQFYINTADNRPLNHTSKTTRGWGYTVFGKVIIGMDVAEAISKVATKSVGSMQNVPVEPITITAAKRLEEAP